MWRHSLWLHAQLCELMAAYLATNPQHQGLLLTLTMKNMTAEKLRYWVDRLLKAFRKLFRYKRVAASIDVWWRVLEITRNPDTGELHPHLHVILMVPPGYFQRSVDKYIAQAEWVRLFRCALTQAEAVLQAALAESEAARRRALQQAEWEVQQAQRQAAEAAAIAAEQARLDTIGQAKLAAQRLGVPVGDNLQAMLDVQAVGLSGGGISLHDGDLPLRRLGLGSSRLFIAALQDHARANASVALIDEVEHGLEPHRISRLLRQLKKAKDEEKIKAQAFMTTHSPVVLQELSVDELKVVGRDPKSGQVTVRLADTPFKELDVQSQPRANPQAYLAPTILVCEGKTEVGLVRGLDDFWVAKDRLPFSTAGVVAVSGGGVDNAPVVAGYFRALGYRVGLFLDSDCEPKDADILKDLQTVGVALFRWAADHATEDHLFRDLPNASVVSLIKAAALTQADEQSIIDRLNRKLPNRKFTKIQDVEASAEDTDVRGTLGELAKAREKKDGRERGWFKDIGLAEWIGRKHVGPFLDKLKGRFPEAIAEIRAWVDREQ
jgi:putative ATP-dependent endonuclease of OLD family